MYGRTAPEDWKPSDGITLEPAAADVVISEESKSVIAGPGAGKTELLAQRALYLLQTGVCRAPRRILAISFKRDAAKTLKDRVSRRSTSDQALRFDSYTFDAFAKSLVDRFRSLIPEWCRPPSDYRVLFPVRNDWRDFIDNLTPPRSIGTVWDARALTSDSIDRWRALPLQRPEPENVLDWAALKWWMDNLNSQKPGVTFPMIGRLAEAILNYNPDVLKALRLTYSHVFLDEFQDTTNAQYSLVKQAFHGSQAILTAVGDTKQRIMTWAGAEEEVFGWFEADFGAERKRLQMNHRSNARIVQIINDLVQVIEPDAVETLCARKDDPVPDDAAEFWIFKTDADEADKIVSFIADEIDSEERVPDDFVMLVRQRANELEAQLRDAFLARGLRMRNEARSISGVAIQDLMADDLVSLLLGLFRLALGVRSAEIYLHVQEALGALYGVDYENAADTKRLDKTVRELLAQITKESDTNPKDANILPLIEALVEYIGPERVRRHYRQYENAPYFRSIREALAGLFKEYAEHVGDWSEWVDAVEGRGQVRLMTIHKSKGLECHTVLFVGLHERAFWGYRNNQGEETNAFFVALSRARERVYFTRSAQSGGAAQIKGLIDLLQAADVPFIQF